MYEWQSPVIQALHFSRLESSTWLKHEQDKLGCGLGWGANDSPDFWPGQVAVLFTEMGSRTFHPGILKQHCPNFPFTQCLGSLGCLSLGIAWETSCACTRKAPTLGVCVRLSQLSLMLHTKPDLKWFFLGSEKCLALSTRTPKSLRNSVAF